jgi:hypothetical protein
MSLDRLSRSKQPPKAVFQGFWHGPPLGELNLACLRSFVDLGYTFELYTYEAFDLPPTIVLKDAAEIIPLQDLFYFDNVGSNTKDLGPFSDLFRFKLLSERGGWWVDVDTICLSPNIPQLDRAWAQEQPEIDPTQIGPGQLALGKGDPLAVELYMRCLAISQTAFEFRNALGPRLFSSVIKERALPHNIYGQSHTFFPIRFVEMYKLWLPDFRDEVEEKVRDAIFLPIYQSFPLAIGLDSSRLPPSGSYLGEFCRRHTENYATRAKHGVEEIRLGTREYLREHSKWALDELNRVSGEGSLDFFGL